MKKVLSLMLAICLTLCCASAAFSGESGEIVLAENGSTQYRIVISETATDTEKFAASELADYLKKISSADFSVVADSEPSAEKEIVVGVTNRDSEGSIDRTGLGEEGVRIVTAGEKLFLTGGARSGGLYAVYTFLEDYLGCRWFTNELTVVPETNRLAIPAELDYTFVPPFKLRQTYWLFSTKYTEFCVKHKLHGVMAYVPDSMGGCGAEYAVNAVHTLQWIVTADKFNEHPEYFGCDENGNRSVNRQPCLSNEDVFNLVVNYALNFFSMYSNVVSISQNDGMQFCKCEKCTAFNKAHGNTDAASMINFVNRVADKVRETYPEARFETLAYQDSLVPPTGLEIKDGITVRMCPVNGCEIHDFDDPACKKNSAFNKAMDGWAKLTDNIYMWNYSTNFQYYYALLPNITTLQSRYQYFRDHNVIAVFDNGCGEDMVPGEFHELKTYLVLRLLWDPDTDIERHISEFCDAYYGEAGKDVVEFIKYYEKAVKGFKLMPFGTCHVTCQDGGESLENNLALSSGEIRKLDKLMQKAESRTLTADEAYRLKGVSIGWRFTKCGIFGGEFNWFSFKNDPIAEAEKLYNDMKDYGITFLSEGGGVRFTDQTPDFTVRPTWWFSEKSSMPQSVQIQSKILPVINKILRTVFGFAA